MDVKEGHYRGYNTTGRLLKIETDGSGVRTYAAGSAPGHTGELEELLRDFLGRVGELTDLGCDLPGFVAACDRYNVETPDGFRAALFGLSGDLWRSVRGQGLRRRGN